MPESLTTGDLNRLRQLAPGDPYARHIYNYGLYMGGMETLRYQTQPQLRLNPEETVSRTYPYVFAQGSEWALPPGWDEGYLSYYAMSGVDDKGAYIAKGNKQVNVPAKMLRSSFQTSRRSWPKVPIAVQPPRNYGPTVSYVSLQG